LIISVFYILYEVIRYRKLNRLLFAEVFCIPLLFVALFAVVNFIGGDKSEYIVSINRNSSTDNFHNPFLSYEMLDCRKLTKYFDVIFVPQHFAIETEYLSYAPRRINKTNSYGAGKKFDEDWYLEFSGSMWNDELRKCYFQTKQPF
jgi:hypothetical protein